MFVLLLCVLRTPCSVLLNVCLTVSFADQFGVLESVKAAADVYSPVSGTVVEVNTLLEDEPDKINKDPYGEGERAY